jgi:AraC-like DNA-binding protein
MASQDGGSEQLLFATTDPEEAHRFMREAYVDNTMRISGSTDGFRMRHTLRDVGRFSIARMDHSMAVEHEAQPLGALLVGRVLAGSFQRDTPGQEAARYGVGDVFLIAEPDRPYTASWDQVSLQLTAIDLDDLADLAQQGGAQPRFRDLNVVSVAAARQLCGAIEFAGSMLANPQAARNPLLIGSTSRLLAAAVLSGFRNDAVELAFTSDYRDASTNTLARAVKFIESNADLDIGVADIARAACVSVRAIQIAFRRHRQLTPTQYLRRVRLIRAHEQLRAAMPGDGTTVTEVAMRWGFIDASRFAADYRSVFGCTPTRTLRGGRSHQ